MSPDNAKKLGAFLRTRREELGLSARKLAVITGINNESIVRIELGQFALPSPDKLARLADALGLPLADVYAYVNYAAPKQLPTLAPYLRTKYRDLPDEAAEQIERYAARLAKRHGVNLAGPAPGEDEVPDDEYEPKTKGGKNEQPHK